MNSKVVCVTLILFVSFCSSGVAAEIYVSAKGDNANSGTKEKPLATIAAAQAKARMLKGEGVTVLLASGTYYLERPLTLTAEDSGTAEKPVVYRAAPGESPILSGGALLQLEWTPCRDGMMQASVPGPIAFDQLFVDGQRQHLARYPNFDPKAKHPGGTAADAISPERGSPARPARMPFASSLPYR